MLVETDQSGLCHDGSNRQSNGIHGKLSTATNQTKCRVAAEARRQHTQQMPASAKTTKLFSEASTKAAVRLEFCTKSEIILMDAFISTAFLFRLVDELLQFVQFGLRQLRI